MIKLGMTSNMIGTVQLETNKLNTKQEEEDDDDDCGGVSARPELELLEG